jgi:hypothetical protein
MVTHDESHLSGVKCERVGSRGPDSVNGVPVDSVDSLRLVLEDLKTADAIALQVERLGSLHYLVLDTDK